MNPIIPAVLAALTLTACSQQFTRYDAEPGITPAAYRSVDNGFAAGFAAIRSGDYAGAEAPLMRHLAVEPTDAYALLAMGAVMERTARADEAITYYRNAAIHGRDAAVGETLALDGKAETVRDVAEFNIARLR